ncbi:MAG: TetR/AcrR family transcriptional regulator [Paracoccaceae bacterium]
MKQATRKYQLKSRAKRQQKTRQRIVDAAVTLHQRKGIQATSMSDVADLANVGRVTVYRHFPDELTLTEACSAQYFTDNPLPDVEAWEDIADPSARLRTGLRETYSYHRSTRTMMSCVLAEARDHPVVAPYHAHWRRAAEVLADAWSAPAPERPVREAALAVALGFDTWRTLAVDNGLDDGAAVEVMIKLTAGWT